MSNRTRLKIDGFRFGVEVTQDRQVITNNQTFTIEEVLADGFGAKIYKQQNVEEDFKEFVSTLIMLVRAARWELGRTYDLPEKTGDLHTDTQAFYAYIKRNPQVATEIAKRAGIIDAQGQLTEAYR